MHLRISQRPPLRIYSRIVLEPRQYLGAIIGGTIAITGTLVGIVALFIYFQRRREKRLHRVPTHFTLLRDQPTPASPQGYPTHIPTILRPGSHVDRNKTDVPGMPPKSLSLKVKLSSLPTSTEPPLASHPYYAYPLISIESNEKNRTLSSAIPPASGHKKIQRVKAKPNLRLEMKPYPPPVSRSTTTHDILGHNPCRCCAMKSLPPSPRSPGILTKQNSSSTTTAPSHSCSESLSLIDNLIPSPSLYFPTQFDFETRMLASFDGRSIKHFRPHTLTHSRTRSSSVILLPGANSARASLTSNQPLRVTASMLSRWRRVRDAGNYSGPRGSIEARRRLSMDIPECPSLPSPIKSQWQEDSSSP